MQHLSCLSYSQQCTPPVFAPNNTNEATAILGDTLPEQMSGDGSSLGNQAALEVLHRATGAGDEPGDR